MKNGLEEAYKQVMNAGQTKRAAKRIIEETSKDVLGEAELVKGQSTATPGKDVFDGYKEASGKQGKHTKESGERCPEEAEDKINPGYGDIKTEGKELADMLPQSKFDVLFKQQIVEEMDDLDSDESPLEMTGRGEFNDDDGDFPSEVDDGVGEEVDVATTLRLVIDQLTEVAEKLGAFDEGMDEADDEVGESGLEDDGLDDELEESHVKLDKLKDTTSQMTSPGNKQVKSAFTVSGKKAGAQGGPGKSAADGKLQPGRKTSLGPHGTQKHPDVKGTMGKTGAGLFDSV